ncbi:nuclear hormone receptor HR96-like isoform X2 [Ostrea edulis]|uniref:nuclear hormone receptor HR96-like isoform X2 n=1 Tax=Ostrea edulis TaxID=37623 RepID=UPI0024AE895A|nr:nuclear hormone receptor HR96-like isoform X2 [Ostrea edulis]
MFSEYNGHHVPPHYGGPHGPPPSHHHGGHMPPSGHHHPMAGPPQSYSPYMRPRMDPTSDVFTCLFGDLFVKCFEDSNSNTMPSMANPYHRPMDLGSNDLAHKARKNKEDKYCGVCGDRALGYNFDAISCESCKAFFRRNAPKGLEYFKCPYEEKCKMDVSNRRFCKRCRLRKCFEIGMRKEYILTEEEKIRKRQRIEENRKVRDVDKQRTQSGIVSTSENRLRALEPDEEYMINEVVGAYRQSLEVSIASELPKDKPQMHMKDLVNIAELSVRRVIDMAKKIKSFKALSQTDQISLLKGGAIELLILRSVISFDKEKNQWLDPLDSEDHSMDIKNLQEGEGVTLFAEHMKFTKSLAIDLKADETMLILLLVISLFSPDRPSICEKSYVYQEQEKYALLLLRYLESRYSAYTVRAIYPKLLMKLTDIRDLNEEHSRNLLMVNPEDLQPLMIELLSMNFKETAAPNGGSPL